MPATAIICGILLILIGIVGYAHGVMTEHASVTALIPAFIGLILVILGFVSRVKENLRKHLMHAAVVIALLGFIATAGRVVSKLGSISASAAVLSQVATAVVCLVFVILAIRSFAAARASRTAE